MKLLISVVLSVVVVVPLWSQSRVWKSYSAYSELEIEDNSFLIEEAFNQGMGEVQYISTLQIEPDGSDAPQFSFTQEIPITNLTHQLSYTLMYSLPGKTGDRSGFGDIFLSYRALMMDENDWMMFIPRVTLIVPTGKSSQGLGAGGWGIQFNAAATKRISERVVMHFNAGFTEYFSHDHYRPDNSDNASKVIEKNVVANNLGGSVVWYLTSHLNILTEYVLTHDQQIGDAGNISWAKSSVINPGLRYGFNLNNTQVVAGLSFPSDFSTSHLNTSALFYLSFEPAYR